MKEILHRLFEHKNLNREEAKRVLVEISGGTHNISQVAAFMTVYCMRSITLEELSSFRDAMLELCVSVDLSEYVGLHLVGTDGVGNHTFNFSSLYTFFVSFPVSKLLKP